MNAGWDKKEVLMVVKTYPTPSTKYKESVCTAGITPDGKWIRLYPIKFRDLQDDQKFEKFTWIEVETIRPGDDRRPESYKVNGDTIKILRHLSPSRDIEERKKYLIPNVKKSLEEIYDQQHIDETSLAIFKPKLVSDLIIEPTDKDWTPNQKHILSQQSIFENENTKRLLQKIPYDFKFKFTCDDSNCKGHTIIITDWEIYQTYRSYKTKYQSEAIALEKLKDAWLRKFTNPKYDAYFIVGTVHRFKNFIIIGYFTCPHEEFMQVSLFENS